MQYFRCCRSLFSKLTSKVTWEGGACTQDASWLIAILRIEAPIYANCPHTITLTNPHCLGYWTCDARAQNGARKDFLGKRYALMPQYFCISFARPAFLYCEEYVCVYTHIRLRRGCKWIAVAAKQYDKASEKFLHKSEAVRSVDWIFIIVAPAWRWLGEYVTFDKLFHIILFKQY